MPKKTPSFEEAFAQLEELVQKLEEGGLPLEEAVTLYERGMALVKQCEGELDKAELRVSQLSATE
jgi:exodeoxyribonuclease VII small subunit